MANARVFAGNVVEFLLHRRFASIIVAVLSFAALTVCLSQTKEQQKTAAEKLPPTSVHWNKAPLSPTIFASLPLGSIKPRGWLRRQLQIQANGLSGHLDEFWPDLSDSGWIGGTGESWERGPYYLDGLVPLAFLLEDPRLIAKAKKWVDWTLEHQREDGQIGAVLGRGRYRTVNQESDTWWPNMIMLKVLTQYQEATNDPRVIPVTERYLEHHLQMASQQPLREWAQHRWADEIVSIIWLYNRTGNPRLLELARKLHEQSYDWKAHFADFKYKRKVTPKEANLHSHGVNNAMAIKTSAVWWQVSGDESDRKAIHQLYEQLDRYHGQATGIHSCDEHYAGLDPSQGTELCAVVEGMFSLEQSVAILGDPGLGDRLERVTFNALPATFKKDMWAHQYDQQVNQVMCSVMPGRNWTTNGPDSNTFGLEPNFGCCTSNMHQGWPKFATHLWMATHDGGLAAVAYAPSQVSAKVRDGVEVAIVEDTDYPFRDTIRLTVYPTSPAKFPLMLRIPAWAQGATITAQYAWFFGGDALINTWALEAAGDHSLACDAVRFIQKYQRKDTGEVFHELSQSAGLIDWFKDYPYGYRHTDISALYLVAFRNLYYSSGDLEFLRSSWDSLRAAYNYLVSRIESSDGLVTIPPGGWGGDETIGEQVVKDVYLESMWVAGGDDFAELATRVGERQLADEARARADKARASLLSKLWNPKRNFFFYGFNGRGELLTQELGQPNWGIWLGVFDPDKAEGALDRMAHANWEADWGLRSIPSDDPLYIGESYGHGSVWPLGTGAQALAFFRYHRPLQGNPLWRALVAQSFLNSLGHVAEVFSGEYYRELDVSVPEQIWSSGMVITSTLRGLLGLDRNAPMAQLSFAPHLPPNWPEVRLRNLKVGLSNVNLEMQQSDAEVRLRVENSGPPVEILFSPEIPLGSKALQATLNSKRLPVTLQSHVHDAHAEVKFSAQARIELVIQFVPGVRVWVPEAALHIGDASRGLKILSSKLEGRSFRAEVEGPPGACSSFVLSTPWQVNQVNGGKVSSHNGNLWQFIVSPQADACATSVDSIAGNNLTSYQSWSFQVEFAP